MRILLSNDDGIYATGINLLADALQGYADVVLVAPDRDRSGASNSLTISWPIRVTHLNSTKIAVEGTPTDCVHMALTGLLAEPPDMVFSGINAGSNLGDDVIYSGTVAAAMEGRYLGLPAIAISLLEPMQHYETACWFAKKLYESLLAYPLPAATILNVNIPDVPINAIQGVEVTRLGARHKAAPIVEAKDPRGSPIYWVGPAGEGQDVGPGTDFYAVKQRKISITPIHIDLTDHSRIAGLQNWLSYMDIS